MSEIKMGFRWFNSDDNISLQQIRQIPQVSQIVSALNLNAGDVWTLNAINQLKNSINDQGFEFKVVESVNVHDDIKAGLSTRDEYIENYITSLKNLSLAGVEVVCYNFMPVFDWIRTNLRAPSNDGSFSMQFKKAQLPQSPLKLSESVTETTNSYTLPGWEADRLAGLTQIMHKYDGVTETQLRENLAYFLKAIIPVCEQEHITMAIHPDDPPMSVFELPRIYKNIEDMRLIENMVPSQQNAFTICTGSLGENPQNDVPAIITEMMSRGKVPFVHLRNVRHLNALGDFEESAHESSTGSLDMFQIMKALSDSGFHGYARPDHGRDIWGESGRPGYGLFDRALGISYLNGLWESLQKMR